MCANDFTISDGQYSIVIEDENATLYKYGIKFNKEICSF